MFKINQYLNKILEIILIILMVFLTLCIIWQVISRYILNEPSTITEELSRFLMIYTCLLGSSYALGKKKHLSIDLIFSYISLENRKKLNTLLNVIMVIFSIVIIYGGTKLTINTFESLQTSPALQIKMGYIYMIIPISFMIILYYSIQEIITQFSSMKNDKE